jgi:hypothetical protein
MIELDDDILKSGSEAWRQAILLVTQAISTPTTHDKNLLIQRLATSYQVGSACAEHLSICIESMRDYLGKVTRKETTSIGAYSVLTTNTAFLSELDQTRDKSSVESQIEQIALIEEEIRTYHPLESPDLLDRYSRPSEPPVVRGIRIQDLMFKRLEEFVTALKKRSLIFDDSDDLILHVTENYGNIAGLLELYRGLQAENVGLRNEELVFEDDSIAKRRLLSITTSQLAKLVFLLQKELKMQHSVGASMTTKPEYGDGVLDFDEICHPESNSLDFLRVEFPTTADSESVEQILTTESPAEKLALLRKLVLEHEVTNQKMTDTINSLRKNEYSSTIPPVSEREHRLWALHQKFSSQIVDLMQKIDDSYTEIDDRYRNLLLALQSNDHSGNSAGGHYHRLIALEDSHIYVRNLLSQNRTLSSNLADLSFLFGQTLLHGAEAGLEAHLKRTAPLFSRPPSERPVQPPPKADDEPPHAPRLLRPGQPDPRGGKRRRKPGHIREIGASESQLFKPNPIDGAARSHLADFLALAHNLRGQARGETPSEYYAVILESMRSTLTALMENLGAEIREVQAEMQAGIERAGLGSTAVLRRPKADIEIQVGLQSLTEIETLTEELEGKGKGKGKAKAPPKKSPPKKPVKRK